MNRFHFHLARPSMRSSLARLLVAFALVSSVFCFYEFSETVNIQTGGWYRFTVRNANLLDWRYLWTSHVVIVEETNSAVPFEVFYSAYTKDMENLLSGHAEGAHNAKMAPCSATSQNSIDRCVFFLSMYGVNTMWWIPRLDYLISPPPPTHVAVHVPDKSVFGNSDANSFSITVLSHTHMNSSPVMFLAGVALFLVARYLCRSLKFYLSMWFIVGALLSAGTLIIVAIYIGLSFSPKLASISGVIALVIGVSYGLFNYDYVMEFFLHPAQQKIWLVLILAGGLAGLMVGYTPKLSALQSSQVLLCSRILAVILIFFSFTQLESGIALTAAVVVLLILLEKMLPFLMMTARKRTKRRGQSQRGDRITLEEYAEEGAELTKEALDNLIDMYEKKPSALHTLSSRAQRRTITLMQRRKRELRRMNK